MCQCTPETKDGYASNTSKSYSYCYDGCSPSSSFTHFSKGCKWIKCVQILRKPKSPHQFCRALYNRNDVVFLDKAQKRLCSETNCAIFTIIKKFDYLHSTRGRI